MNLSELKEQMGLTPKSSLSLTDRAVEVLESMVGKAIEIGTATTRVSKLTAEIAVMFYDIVTESGANLKPSNATWSDTRKAFEFLCASTGNLKAETARRYMNDAVKLLKPEGEGVEFNGNIVTLEKPVNESPDATRMRESRAKKNALFADSKGDPKSDDELTQDQESLIKLGGNENLQQAGKIAKELETRDRKAQADSARADKKVATDHNNKIKSALPDAGADARVVAHMILSPSGSKEVRFVESVMADYHKEFGKRS